MAASRIKAGLRGITMCPVTGRGCPYQGGPNNAQAAAAAVENAMSKCPFLQKLNAASQCVDLKSSANTCPMRKPKTERMDYNAFMGDMVKSLKSEGRYREFIKIERERGSFPAATANGQRDVTNWCSNDYLAMGQAPSVMAAAQATALSSRSGISGVRNASHMKLESELAALHGKSGAMVFNSCYTANECTLNAIVRAHPGCTILSDSDNHASMIQGIRQSDAAKLVWRHNDLAHLEEQLSLLPRDAPKLIVFESVYSMDGTVSPIGDVVKLAKKYGAMTFLDEVHAVGLYGEEGAGIAQRDGVMTGVDVISGTLGKAYGVIGGYVALEDTLAATIRSYCEENVPYQLDNFMPTPVADAARASVKHLRSSDGQERRRLHQDHAAGLTEILQERGLPVMEESESHIVPVLVGDPTKCKAASDMLLLEHDIYVQPINYPTVPRGTERLRFTPGPLHTPDMQQGLGDALEDVWKKLNIDVSVCA